MAGLTFAKNTDAYIASAQAKMGINVTGVLIGTGTWIDFLTALGGQEGNGSYSADNGQGYIGIYQFANYEMRDRNGNLSSIFYTLGFQNSIGAMLNATTDANYMDNPIAQELSALMEFSGLPIIGKSFLSQYDTIYNAVLSTFDLNQLLGKVVTINYTDPNNNVVLSQTFTVTQAGLSTAAHLIGAQGVANALLAAYNQWKDPKTGDLVFNYDANGNQIPLVASLPETGNYADGNGVAFSTYAKLFQNFDISTLVNAQPDPANTQFNDLAQQLILAHQTQILSYLTTNKQPVLMSMTSGTTDYSETIKSILTGLGYSTLTNQLGDITGKVVLAGGSFMDSVVFASSDLIIGLGSGSQTLGGGSGNDVLIAGKGKDLLVGGAGTDTYILNSSSQNAINDTIKDDKDGLGIVMLNGAPLTGTDAKYQGNDIWLDDKTGTQYQLDQNRDILTITSGSDTITIDDFKITADGYLGIKLDNQITIAAGIKAINAAVDQAAEVLKGVVSTFTVGVATVSDKAQTLRLQLAEGIADTLWKLINGAETLSFGADGSIAITIPAGQDSVTLALLDTSGNNSADTAKLTASLTDASGTITSNNLTVTFDSPNPGAGVTPDNVFVGTAGSAYGTDSYNSNNLYQPNGGSVYAFGDGDNTIIGGDGGYTGGAGGAAGYMQDLIVGNGNNQIYVGTQVDVATAISNQKTLKFDGTVGASVRVGNGNNTIIGGLGYDVIQTGTGNNTIVCGPGNDALPANMYDGNSDRSGGVWVVCGIDPSDVPINQSALLNYFEPFYPTGAYSGSYYKYLPVSLGNNTIFGSTRDSVYLLSNGNNWLDAGGGNDYIQAGTGNSTIYGGTGNCDIYGGGGNNYINLESGNDSVMAQGGNNTIIGGSGNDSIISGDFDNWATSETKANNYIYGGSGQTTIYGSGGNDTLISGSESGSSNSTIIHAGDGNEYIVGGSNKDTIVGGAGSDTIYAGDGNTYIQLSTDAKEQSWVYGGNGSDSIVGGAGSDLIGAGDGGTTAAPTLIQAGTGSSMIYGGAGVDIIFGSTVTGGNDTLIAGTGTSTLQGGAGTELMYSSTGNATLIAGTGSDTLYGGSGNDKLYGTSGTTLFVAGSGNETIIGGSGANTYEFDAGFGNVQLTAQGSSTFKFGAGISAADLTVSKTGSTALLIQSASGGQLTLNDGMAGAIGQFAFADGSTLALRDQDAITSMINDVSQRFARVDLFERITIEAANDFEWRIAA